MESVVDWVIGVHSPPPTGVTYAFQMPVLFDENRMRFSSAENDAPRDGRRVHELFDRVLLLRPRAGRGARLGGEVCSNHDGQGRH